MDKFPFTKSAASAPPIAILGVPFDNITTAEAVESIEKMVASRLPHYLATANVDFLVQAMHDVELRRILMDAHLVLCDGTPLVWASKLLGNPLPERVAGSDLVPLLLDIAAKKKYRVFFLGGTALSIKKAVDKLRRTYPKLAIVGSYSPPFLPLCEMNHGEITRRIRKAKPDLLFVSFGCPKQEKWISMHYRSLGVPVCVGVGGTIDFLAGTTKRAPRWMQKVGMEWTFRLAQEPRRLLKRYLNDLFWFSQAILRQWWQMRVGTVALAPVKTVDDPAAQSERSQAQVPQTWRCVKMPREMDIQSVRTNALACEEALACSRYCLLELDEVRFIDSTGMGLLIRLQNKARISSRHVILVAPSDAVRSALKLMRLQDFFNIAGDMKEAQKFMENQITAKAAPAPITVPPTSQNIFAWKGEVTAANVDDVWQITQTFITACAKNGGLQIDLSSVPFIDSTGLGLMIKARKVAAQLGAKVTFLGAQPNVLNVLRIAKLESLLLGSAA